MIEQEVNLPLRFLRLLSGGGICSIADLARQLGVSDGLVTMMAEDLTRRGYLVALSGGGECKTDCAGCGLAAGCSVPSPQERLPTLTLTPRGRQMAAS